MKKYLFLFLTSALLVSCSNSAGEVAEKFTEAVAKGQVDEAKEYATEATGKLLDFAASMGAAKVRSNVDYTIVKDSVVDDRAWVTLEDQKGNREEVDLVKIDGKWLVTVDNKK